MFLFVEKLDDRKEKILGKKGKIRKDVPTILGQKEGCGDETTLIGVCAHVEVHTIQFSLHMQSGSSQRSLGDSIIFSMVVKGLCITTGTKNGNIFFSKNEGKRRNEKQEIEEKKGDRVKKEKKEKGKTMEKEEGESRKKHVSKESERGKNFSKKEAKRKRRC